MKSLRFPFVGELLLATLVLSTAVFAQTPTPTQIPSQQPNAPAASSPQSTTPQGTSAPASTPGTSPSTTEPGTVPQDPTSKSPSGQPTTAPGDQNAQPSAQQDSSSNDSKDSKDKDKDKNKHVKAGSENDVEAIGNRDMGKRGLGNWYSLEKEIRMGKEYAQQIEQSAKLVQDPVINEYVNRIGQNLVRNSDAKVPFTIKVIDSDEINAFALPGGFFYVNSGLILAADEEAELAGVMAHEIAHVAARHATRQMTRSQWANFASLPLIFVGGGIGYAARSIAGIGLPLTFLSFSRGFESEADYLGTQYMYASGYDPQAMISFFEKIESQEKKKPGSLAKAFGTHPPTPDRVSKIQNEIATILPGREQYTVTTSEFDTVKARLAALENHRKLNEDKDGSKPTLRRKTADSSTTTDKDGKDKDKTNGDDDRPTLKRRDNP
jgi:hypothetical protein